MSNNQLVAIEQKPSLMDSIKSFFYKIGNGAKKMDGEFENLKDTTNSIKNSDIPALEKKYMDEGIKQAMFIEEKNSELVVGKKESRANTEMFKEVTKTTSSKSRTTIFTEGKQSKTNRKTKY
jgi:hypothetical protein